MCRNFQPDLTCLKSWSTIYPLCLLAYLLFPRTCYRCANLLLLHAHKSTHFRPRWGHFLGRRREWTSILDITTCLHLTDLFFMLIWDTRAVRYRVSWGEMAICYWPSCHGLRYRKVIAGVLVIGNVSTYFHLYKGIKHRSKVSKIPAMEWMCGILVVLLYVCLWFSDEVWP
jgi:hypothetical protein